jgi:hypothetical protein
MGLTLHFSGQRRALAETRVAAAGAAAGEEEANLRVEARGDLRLTRAVDEVGVVVVKDPEVLG